MRGAADCEIQDADERAGVKAVRAELDSLTLCQRLQAGRKIRGAGHAGLVHQDGDDADTAVQCGLDLQADEIVGVVQAPPPVLVGDSQPPLADDGN
jgi:hypothetical protein